MSSTRRMLGQASPTYSSSDTAAVAAMAVAVVAAATEAAEAAVTVAVAMVAAAVVGVGVEAAGGGGSPLADGGIDYAPVLSSVESDRRASASGGVAVASKHGRTRHGCIAAQHVAARRLLDYDGRVPSAHTNCTESS